MPEENARIVLAGIVGITITVSMIAMAVASIVTSRKRKGLDESGISRLEDRLERMELAIDAMATEVERVAEGQRFTSRLLADRQVERQA
jgi:ribosomal protein S13